MTAVPSSHYVVIALLHNRGKLEAVPRDSVKLSNLAYTHIYQEPRGPKE